MRLVLGAISIVLAGLAAAPWLETTPAGDARPQEAATHSAPEFDFNDPGPLEIYDALLQRPVFVASRRPLTVPDIAPGRPGEVLLLERYPIVGVIIAGERRLVLIRKAAGDTVSRIEQGAELDGWTLTEVSRQRLVLEMAGNRKEVSLQNNGSSTD
jgi:hypothetical protein